MIFIKNFTVVVLSILLSNAALFCDAFNSLKERLPSGNTNTYRYMDYRALTDESSEQYEIQRYCCTDADTGIRYLVYEDERYFCAALGSAYGQNLGDLFQVSLESGSVFRIVYADFKNSLGSDDFNFFGHPDRNYDGELCTNVVEFVVDTDRLPSSVAQAGTLSALSFFGGLNGSGGNIVRIEYIGRFDGVMLSSREINSDYYEKGVSFMIKSIYGPIANPETGESKGIVVTALNSKNIRDFMIGGGIALIGITYLALSAFRNGANAFEEAEYKTLEELDLFK